MATKISELPAGQKVGRVIDETILIEGGATTATTATATVARTTATTNTVEPLLDLDRQSSGTPANGIGGSLRFKVETAAGNTEIGATIEAVTTDVTSTSEDFDIVFKTMAAGAAATESLRVKSTGRVDVGDPARFYNSPVLNLQIGSGTAVIGAVGTGVLAVNPSAALVALNGYGSAASVLTGADVSLVRNAAGVWRSSTSGVTINGFLGGGAAVASAAALPVPTGRVFHVTGTTGITSITSTNFGAGAVITMIFDGILTVSDGNNLKLAGAFVTAADSTLTLAYDGSNWYEVARSTN